jgi:glycosyltransferase involved in cell wall biosynthesis
MKKILIITNYGFGGVLSMLNLVCVYLKNNNVKYDICYYAPFSIYKNLSVPIYNFLAKKPKFLLKKRRGHTEYKIGSRFPELEFLNHQGSVWKKVLYNYDLIFNISGTLINSIEAVNLKKKIIHWIASPVLHDRESRIKSKSFLRRIFDYIFIRPKISNLEKKILEYKKQKIYAISDYTKKYFEGISKTNNIKKLSYGIDTKLYYNTKKRSEKKFTIGFIGRVDDPRKNINLLLEIYKKTSAFIPDLQLKIIGGSKDPIKKNKEKNILYKKFPSKSNGLRDYYSSIDIFIVCSFQEGLCISALEAMACGCVVLSTPCLGTKEFVINDKTGHYLSFESNVFVKKIIYLYKNKKKLKILSKNSIKLINNHYSKDLFLKNFNLNINGA